MKIEVYNKTNKVDMYWVDTIKDNINTYLTCIDRSENIIHPFIVIDNKYRNVLKEKNKMYIEITKEALEEINSKMDKLGEWCVNNFVNFESVCFVVQTIINGLDEARKELEKNETVA